MPTWAPAGAPLGTHFVFPVQGLPGPAGTEGQKVSPPHLWVLVWQQGHLGWWQSCQDLPVAT